MKFLIFFIKTGFFICPLENFWLELSYALFDPFLFLKFCFLSYFD